MDNEFKDALTKEVKSARDTLISLGNLVDTVRTDSAEFMVGSAWNKALDNAYDIIARFADEHGIEAD